MTIIPILRRELVAAARKAQLQSGRSFFAGMLLAIVLGTFGAWYYWDQGSVSPQLMGTRREAVVPVDRVALHAISIFGVATAAALSIAGEKDRRTLDFLLATRLSNAEIVLGKLDVFPDLFLSTVVAGLPVMLLLNTLGSIDLGLILLTYAVLRLHGVFPGVALDLGFDRRSDSRQRHFLDPLHDRLAGRSLLRGLRLSSVRHPTARLRLDRECLAPGQQPLGFAPEDRRRNLRVQWTDRRSRPDERIATDRGRSLPGLGDRSPALGLSDQRQR